MPPTGEQPGPSPEETGTEVDSQRPVVRLIGDDASIENYLNAGDSEADLLLYTGGADVGTGKDLTLAERMERGERTWLKSLAEYARTREPGSATPEQAERFRKLQTAIRNHQFDPEA